MKITLTINANSADWGGDVEQCAKMVADALEHLAELVPENAREFLSDPEHYQPDRYTLRDVDGRHIGLLFTRS